MPLNSKTESSLLRNSSRYQAAKRELLSLIEEASRKIHKISPAKLEGLAGGREEYLTALEEFNRLRGRELYYPFLGSGLGSGPYVELADGSVKLDMITGIGVQFFGHSHQGLMEEVILGLPSDVMQGNLQPGLEALELLKTLLAKVGKGSRLSHGWISCSGTMSNEVALKIIRQKKFPATRILAFKDCFAGRSTALQEITDNAAYRQGQPIYGEVGYLPFYDEKVGLSSSIEATLRALQDEVHRYPGKYAALMLELVQGEGGFRFAPREFYVRVFEEARKAGLAIWVDEVQTFGRTGQLFAFQTFDLNEYVDVVTLGKMLQACMVLYSSEFNPKPGLVAGTFSGSTAALRSARKVIELLCNDGFLGKGGKIEVLSSRFREGLEKLSLGSCSGKLRNIRVLGGMVAFEPLCGSMEDVKAVLLRLFDLGVIAFSCGHGPYLVRLLPPLGVMNGDEVDEVCRIIEKATLDTVGKK